MPRYAVPFAGWIAIAVVYYVICFTVACRLLLTPLGNGRTAGLSLLAVVMFLNALWNYFFFRTRNLRHVMVLNVIYSAAACALFVVLLNVDRTAAWSFLPYVLYLGYANLWGYQLWKLND